MTDAYVPRHADPNATETPDVEQVDAMDADEWLDWFWGLSPEFRATHRDWLMCEGLKAGLTLKSLGELFGISRERVRQITQRLGLNARELKQERRIRAERHQRRIARRVYGLSLSYPELAVEEIADAVECDEATVLKALQNRRGVHHQQGGTTGANKISDEALLAAIAEWGMQTTHPTGDDYTAWAARRGIPGSQTVLIRFGSWNAGLALAGLSVQSERALRPQIDDATLWATLYEFFTSDSPSFSVQGYDQWAQANDRASLATLRNRLGTWNSMWLRTRKLMRYAANRDGSWPWAEQVLSIVPGNVERHIFNQQACQDALRAVAERATGPLTVQAYDAHRAAHEPAGVVIQKKWGSWIRALHFAGLDERMSGKAKGKVARGEVDLSPITAGRPTVPADTADTGSDELPS